MTPHLIQFIKLFLFGITIIVKVACNTVEVKSLNIQQTVPNDYFAEIKSLLKSQDENSSISVTMPIKKNLDENFQIKANLRFNNKTILHNYVTTVCSVFGQDNFLHPVMKKIEPTDKSSNKCPFTAGEWKITDYIIKTRDFAPFNVQPTGKFDVELDIGLPNVNPLIKAFITGIVKSTPSPASQHKLYSVKSST